MAKGEIPDGPKDDYRNGLREKNGMRCEHLLHSGVRPEISILIVEIRYSLPRFLDFYLDELYCDVRTFTKWMSHVDGFESEVIENVDLIDNFLWIFVSSEPEAGPYVYRCLIGVSQRRF